MERKKRGLFLTFEGGEGAGKTTLIQSLAKSFGSTKKVVTTREPGGSRLGEQIRKWLLDHDPAITIGQHAELLLFLAARAQHIEELIAPALIEGSIVLCDRFNDSTIAYQGIARGLGLDITQQLCALVCRQHEPDLTFYLDIDPEIGLKRTREANKENATTGSMDRIEKETLEFHQHVRQAFLEIAQRNPQRIHVLDASRPADEVYAAAVTFLREKNICEIAL